MSTLFGRFSDTSSWLLGTASAFAISVILTLLWLFSGPLFGWSDTWQLVINTFTTVVTFLMIFLLQHTQNRDTKALHMKLDEIIHSLEDADDDIAGVEKKLS